MDSKTYTKNAIKTESVPATLEINQISLYYFFEAAIAAAELANQLKRKLYYGKPIEREKIKPVLATLLDAASWLDDLSESGAINDRLTADNFANVIKTSIKHFPPGDPLDPLDPSMLGIDLDRVNARLLHAALGVFSESGEMLEALKKQYETGELDAVNFAEEVGDTQWYTAIACDAMGVDLDAIRVKNIAKLAKRYPDRFCAEAALNRDVAAERATLEAP